MATPNSFMVRGGAISYPPCYGHDTGIRDPSYDYGKDRTKEILEQIKETHRIINEAKKQNFKGFEP
jgi:hypothetical protein